jgi:hypothetical protein
MMNASFASLYIGTLNNQQKNHVSIMNSDTSFTDRQPHRCTQKLLLQSSTEEETIKELTYMFLLSAHCKKCRHTRKQTNLTSIAEREISTTRTHTKKQVHLPLVPTLSILQ